MADDTSTNPVVDAPETDAPEQEQENVVTVNVPPEVTRALRKANKEAETLRLRLKEYEDRDKTEQQRLEERAAAAETRAKDLELRALRLEVASEKGLSSAQAKRLVGGTREELEADADELRATFSTPAVPAAPRPDPSQGARSGAPTSGRDEGLAQARKRFGQKAGA